MEIEKKLLLSQRQDAICFIREGMFVQLFNVSLYIALEHLNPQLKVTGHRYKKLNNELILRAGLPISLLEKNFPDIVPTVWGYKLSGHWDLSGYQAWYQYKLQHIITLEQKTLLLQQSMKTS